MGTIAQVSLIPAFRTFLIRAIPTIQQSWQLRSPQAITDDPKLMRAKSVKAALTRWLRDNARKLRLTKKGGSVNELAIEEIAKVANWDPKGGARPRHRPINPPIPKVPTVACFLSNRPDILPTPSGHNLPTPLAFCSGEFFNSPIYHRASLSD
jgi:hypothetical protein